MTGKMKRITGPGALLMLLVMSFSLAASTHSYKTPTDTSRAVSVEIVKDDPIVAMLDSLAFVAFKGMPVRLADRDKLNVHGYAADYVPVFGDSVYQARIESLNRQSPFGFIYNPLVRTYIDLYAVRKRALTERILGLANVYFPLFEEQLDRYNLPLELKYLAVIESALNPVARSHAGAKGLWQFMYYTGKLYDLQVSSYVDDRFDPYKATDAACRHMKDLYAIYNDWSLVLAAYNSGAGNVNRAIRKAGGLMDYWAIQRFLPRETRNYVPAFIAVSYVMHHAAEHNLFPVHPGIVAAEIDTVTVKKVLSFDQISEMFNIPVENLRFLNPAYTKDLIPATENKTYFLRLPVNMIAMFINNEEALYSYKTQKGLEREKLLAQVRDIQDRTVTHVVKRGETLAGIARKYRCTTTDLRRWNGLKKNTVKANQELLVYVSAATKEKIEAGKTKEDSVIARKAGQDKQGNGSGATADSVIGPPTLTQYLGMDAGPGSTAARELDLKREASDKVIYHTIRHGDTLWGIANQYKGVTVEQIKQWNKITNARNIKPGQKIKIALGEG